MEIYTKRNTHVVTELERYSDKSIKVCWFEKFGKSVHLASARPTLLHDKSLVKLSVRISVDELHELINVLSKIDETDTNHYYIISQGTNWKKEKEQLVLQTSEYNGLELARFSAAEPPIEIVESDEAEEEEDPDPSDEAPQTPTPTVEWKKDFNKFHISRKDNWAKIAATLRNAGMLAPLMMGTLGKILNVKINR